MSKAVEKVVPALGAHAVQLRQAMEASVTAKREFLERLDQLAIFDAAAGEVVAAYRAGGRLYIAGNGGSAADAQHLAAEFVSKLARDRGPLPAEALTVDTSILTAVSNDYGYDEVFARQVEGKMCPGDVFLGITTSGNSPNIIKALERCRSLGIRTILFTGQDGGKAAALADHCVIATGERTDTIQELHLVLEHTLCACVEAAMFPDA